MIKLICLLVVFLSVSFANCSDTEIKNLLVNSAESLEFECEKASVAILLETYSKYNGRTEKSMILSYLNGGKKWRKLSSSAEKKQFLKALSEIVIDTCDNGVEEAEHGIFSEQDRDKLFRMIMTVSDELKHIKDFQNDQTVLDLLDPMMISILGALSHFQPISETSHFVIPKISPFCVSAESLDLLFRLVLGNMNVANTKLPLLKINSKIKSKFAYESFTITCFTILRTHPELVPTQFLLWNIINGPDNSISTDILLKLAKNDVLVPYLLKKPTEIFLVFKKIVKEYKLDSFLSLFSSVSDSAVLKEVECLRKGYEIYETVKNMNLSETSLEILNNYLNVLEKGSEYFKSYYRIENIFEYNFVIELNKKIFKTIEDFKEIGCLDRKRILKDILFYVIKCFPTVNFHGFPAIDYEPFIDFLSSQGFDQSKPTKNFSFLPRILCLPYAKITETFLVKFFNFYFERFPSHEKEISYGVLTAIMIRESPDNYGIDNISVVHKFYQSFQFEFSEIISILIIASIERAEFIYFKNILKYAEEHKLIDKNTQLILKKLILNS